MIVSEFARWFHNTWANVFGTEVSGNMSCWLGLTSSNRVMITIKIRTMLLQKELQPPSLIDWVLAS